jgi:hypothetical protein
MAHTLRIISPKTEWSEKIHGFLDPADDKPEHYAAIGRLVSAFNGIDAILNWVLRYQLGAETKRGRAVIGGMRTGDMLSAIKRLAIVNGMDKATFAALEELHRQIDVLKCVRDDVAHKIWAVRGEEMSFSNSHVSRLEDSADFSIYTITELNELARYAPYLSERMLNFFPGTIARGGPLPSRDIPARLVKRFKTPGEGKKRSRLRRCIHQRQAARARLSG